MPIQQNEGSTTITGNAIMWYRAALLRSALKLYLDHGMKATRTATPANMRAIAEEYTGTKYPRSRKGLTQALVDITAVCDRNPDSVTPNGKQG